MTNPLLPPLPDAVLYSEIMRAALHQPDAANPVDWGAFNGAGDVFIFCVAIGLASGIAIVGYTKAPTLPVTHRVILSAAGISLAIAALGPPANFEPLSMTLIAACGALSLVLEIVHRVRAIAAYAHVRLEGHQ